MRSNVVNQLQTPETDLQKRGLPGEEDYIMSERIQSRCCFCSAVSSGRKGASPSSWSSDKQNDQIIIKKYINKKDKPCVS